MNGRRALVLAACVWAAAGAPLVACALNFDRYNPLEASPEASTDDVWSDSEQLRDASPDSARVDARGDTAASDASPDHDGASSCTTPATCFQQATTCGSACGQAYQGCVGGCDASQGCTQSCTNTRQSCLGSCATTCIGCTQDAGCPAATKCLDAAHT